jgi:hypothetical protein
MVTNSARNDLPVPLCCAPTSHRAFLLTRGRPSPPDHRTPPPAPVGPGGSHGCRRATPGCSSGPCPAPTAGVRAAVGQVARQRSGAGARGPGGVAPRRRARPDRPRCWAAPLARKRLGHPPYAGTWSWRCGWRLGVNRAARGRPTGRRRRRKARVARLAIRTHGLANGLGRGWPMPVEHERTVAVEEADRPSPGLQVAAAVCCMPVGVEAPRPSSASPPAVVVASRQEGEVEEEVSIIIKACCRAEGGIAVVKSA